MSIDREAEQQQHRFNALRDLWRTVLERAVQDAKHGPSHFEYRGLAQAAQTERFRRATMRSARAWFAASEKDYTEPVGSLRWICTHIGLDADAVREAVLRRRRKR